MRLHGQLLFLFAGCLVARAVTVTPGVALARAATASTTAGTDALTITAQPAGEQQFELGQVLQVQTISGLLIVQSFTQTGNPATTATVLHVVKDDQTAFSAGSTTSGLSVRIIADYLDHASFRVWNTTDVNACLSIWYDTTSHSAATDPTVYRARSNETSCNYTLQAADAIGLAPSTRYYFRINAKTTYGTDNSAACNTSACGSIEFALTTPADTHDGTGKPPLPTLPDPVASWVITPPDTSAYTVVPVPQFPDGVVTATTGTAGSTALTVNTVPTCSGGAGMCVGQWILIAGTTCNFGNAPWCQITAIAGNVLTLNQALTTTVSSGAAVTWGLLTVQDMLYAPGNHYGTVFEFAQGYRAKMWPTNYQAGRDGIRIPGLPIDPAASSIDDPAHRWIVIRTAATPAKIPPIGIRTGREFAPALGGPSVQYTNDFSTAAFILSGLGNNSMPVHHIRFENLAAVAQDAANNYVDPYFYGGFLTTENSSGVWIPRYIVLDRVYAVPPSIYVRTNGITFSAFHGAIVNSYLEDAFWRPTTVHYGPDLTTNANPSIAANTITLPGYQWQRNSYEPLVSQGNATVTATGTASGTVNVYLVMDAAAGNGVAVLYTSGLGVVLACPACRSVTGSATPTVSPTQKLIFFTQVPSGSPNFSGSTTYGDSAVGVTEGPNSVQIDWGHHFLVANNHISGSNKGLFVDVAVNIAAGTSAIRPPEHLTVSRNEFAWPDSRRLTSAGSDGFYYAARHCGFEAKRVLKAWVKGNNFSGGFANVNRGGCLVISATSYDVPVNGRVEDYTAQYNVFHNISSAFEVNAHYVDGGANYSMSADTARVYFGQNLIYDQNAWRQHVGGPAFLGVQNPIGGHDTIVERNTFYDGYGNLPIIAEPGEDRSEGVWVDSNIWYGNVSNNGYLLFHRQNTGLAPIPDTTYADVFGGAAYDAAWAAAAFRWSSGTTTPNYHYANNLFVCGSQQNSTSDSHVLASDVDFAPASCSNHAARFGALQGVNTFIGSQATKALRTAQVGWVNPAAYDYRYQSSSPYKSVGADVGLINDQSGVVQNISAAPGPTTTTITADVPDLGSSCYMSYGIKSTPEGSWTWLPADTSAARTRTFVLSGVSGPIYARLRCANAPPSGLISTYTSTQTNSSITAGTTRAF